VTGLAKKEYLERAEEEGTPVIDGDQATFLWFGKDAPQLVGDITDWNHGQPITMNKSGAKTWSYTIKLPADAYIEYAYSLDGKRVEDPFNKTRVPNGMGEFVQSSYMPAAEPSPWTKRRRKTQHGEIIHHKIRVVDMAASGKRTIHFYKPPTPGPYPLLVVLDGGEYLKLGKIQNIVDNLIQAGRIRPIAMALVENGGVARYVEYACNEATVAFLRQCVLPEARSKLNLLDIHHNPSAYGIMGASMGGLMAMYAAVRLPSIFGSALCQSGAYSLNGHETILFDLIRQSSPKPVRLWMDAGIYDHRRLIAANQAMYELLISRAYAVAYREYSAGHNYTAWRNDLHRGLEYLFPK